MIVCVDVGNTNIACGVYSQGAWIAHYRLATGLDRTSDEFRAIIASLLAADNLDPSAVGIIVVSSVVPGVSEAIAAAFSRLCNVDPLIVTALSPSGLVLDIDNPRELGPDLLANAVAGYEKIGGPCVVVDFGTALSMTIVGIGGVIKGVAIAPGLRSAVKALSSNTAQLPHVQLSPPPSVIGKNTVHAIQSGIVFGYVGMVEHMVKRISESLGYKPAVIATGGLSGVIAPLTDAFSEIDPWLTLDGLRLLGEMNKKQYTNS